VLAAGEPTPGGGGAAALTGSQAAALVSMVINFTVGRKKYAEVEAEMRGYLARARRCAANCWPGRGCRRRRLRGRRRHLHSAQGERRREGCPHRRHAGRAQARRRRALCRGEKCMEIMRLAAPVGAKGNSNVVSDAATALYLAFAALKSAVVNVNINLKFIKDEHLSLSGRTRSLQLSGAGRRRLRRGVKSPSKATLGVAL
jgi:formiminotetrahydrofolate cyclodeaminase